MFSKFIQVSAVACALALGGTAVANNNGGSQSQSTQQQQPQMQQGQQQQGQQGQQGQTQTQQTQQSVKSVRLTSLDQNQIKEVQTRLKDCGFYRGAVDGVIGNGTKSALTAFFQNQLTLAQQGRLSDEALSGFGFGQNDIQRVRGVDNGNQNGDQQNKNNTNNDNVNNQRQNTNGQQ